MAMGIVARSTALARVAGMRTTMLVDGPDVLKFNTDWSSLVGKDACCLPVLPGVWDDARCRRWERTAPASHCQAACRRPCSPVLIRCGRTGRRDG